MVPSPGSPQAPCFPQCVQWILENQLDNGSWGHSETDSLADKETILATLACAIALKKWDVGSVHITKGIDDAFTYHSACYSNGFIFMV